MHRIDEDGHVNNRFSEGDPATGQPATRVGAPWLNAVQEELAGAVESAGLELNKAASDQLAQTLALLSQGILPGGRLSLAHGISVTRDDITATTVYYNHYTHGMVPLWDGERWTWRAFAALSQGLGDAIRSPAAAVADSNYDLFVWEDDGGTLRLSRGPAWSGDQARGAGAGSTELERLAGRWVNRYGITNGPAARRGLYVGTIRTTSTAQAEDSAARRYVWNAYNRIPRAMHVAAAGNWTYGDTSSRQAGGNAAHQLAYVAGLSEDSVRARVEACARNDSATGGRIWVGIGIDGTTNAEATRVPGELHTESVYAQASATYVGVPGIGRRRLVWLEWANPASAATVWGQPGIVGITGEILA